MTQARQQESFNRSLEQAAAFADRDANLVAEYNQRGFNRGSDVLLSSMRRSNELTARQSADALEMLQDSFFEGQEQRSRFFFDGLRESMAARNRTQEAENSAAAKMREISRINRENNLEAVANLSQTASKFLQDQAKRNAESEMQRGLFLANTDPDGYFLSEEERQQYMEAQGLVRGEAQKAGIENDLLASVDVEVAEFDRSNNPVLKGWAAYGAAQGRAARAATMAPTMLETFLSSTEQVLSHPETGQPISPAEMMRSSNPAMVRAAIDAGVNAIMDQSGLQGLNREILNEKFFPSVTQLKERVLNNTLQDNRQNSKVEADERILGQFPAYLETLEAGDIAGIEQFSQDRITDFLTQGTAANRAEAGEMVISGMARYAAMTGRTEVLVSLAGAKVNPNDPKSPTWAEHPRYGELIKEGLRQANQVQAAALEQEEALYAERFEELRNGYNESLSLDEDGSNSAAIRAQYMEGLEELAPHNQDAHNELMALRADPTGSNDMAFAQLLKRAQNGDHLSPEELAGFTNLTKQQRDHLLSFNPEHRISKMLEPLESGRGQRVRSTLLAQQREGAKIGKPDAEGNQAVNPNLDPPGSWDAMGAEADAVAEGLALQADAQLRQWVLSFERENGQLPTESQARQAEADIINRLVASGDYNMEKDKHGVWRAVGDYTNEPNAVTPDGQLRKDNRGQTPKVGEEDSLLLDGDELEAFAKQVEQGNVPRKIEALSNLTGLSALGVINQELRKYGKPEIKAPADSEALEVPEAVQMMRDPRRGMAEKNLGRMWDEMFKRDREISERMNQAVPAAPPTNDAAGEAGEPTGGFGGEAAGFQVASAGWDDDFEQSGKDIWFPGGGPGPRGDGYGAPIPSPVDGVVLAVGVQPEGGSSFGKYNVIQYTAPNGESYSYMVAHLDDHNGLKVGQKITKGQVVGIQGLTGSGTGPHVSFHVNGAGNKYGDPLTGKAPRAELNRLVGIWKEGWTGRTSGTGGGRMTRGDRISQQVQAVKPLLDVIASGEAASEDEYNSIAGTWGASGVDLVNMTIGQVAAYDNNAKGRYQMIPSTLKFAMKRAGLKSTDKFTPENQDKMALALLVNGQRPTLAAYLKGESDNLTGALTELTQEWAAFKNLNGAGAYDHMANNNATIGAGTAIQFLKKARNALSQLN